ncbi:MAG: shikimate kinase, partial [Candidatus Borkfalkiaceae bacterium]|nr:shikimate kinase [Christensenellaceae bacterium]
IEELAVNDACQRRGVIIVAGGGAVEAEKNCRAIRRCGKVIWVDRSVDELTDEHRPVAKRVGAKKLYEMRRPLYSAVCDIKLRNDNPENCAKEILKLI